MGFPNMLVDIGVGVLVNIGVPSVIKEFPSGFQEGFSLTILSNVLVGLLGLAILKRVEVNVVLFLSYSLFQLLLPLMRS
jgi:hypothetical protein